MFKGALQQLYDSSIAYGMKKALIANQSKSEMAEKIKALQKENNELTRNIGELEEEQEEIVKRDEEERERVIEDHAEMKRVAIENIAVLKIELDKVLSTKV